MDGKEDRIEGFHSLSSSSKVNLNETCDLPSRPLVTAGENQSPLVSMGFTLGNHIEAGKIAREKGITHPDVTLCHCIAQSWIGHRKRKGIPYPEALDSLLNKLVVKNLGRMVFASVDNGNTRASSHETGDDFIPCCFDPYGVEDLHDHGKDHSDGLG
jgi:hypothetical protein